MNELFLKKVKHVVWAIVGLKGLGGLLFVVGNIFGAYLLVSTFSVLFINKYSKLSCCLDL